MSTPDQATTGPETIRNDKTAQWVLVLVLAMFVAVVWMSREAWMPASDRAEDARARAESAPADALKTRLTEQYALEQKRLADLKAETEAMEERRREAEQDLEELRALRAEVEQERAELTRLLEQDKAMRAELAARRAAMQAGMAKQAAAHDQMEQARLDMERKLAQEQAQREAVERKARDEARRLAEAKRAAEQAARERALAEAELQAAQLESVKAPPTASAAKAAPLFIAPDATESAVANTEFEANPCEGPSARFLSTCR